LSPKWKHAGGRSPVKHEGRLWTAISYRFSSKPRPHLRDWHPYTSVKIVRKVDCRIQIFHSHFICPHCNPLSKIRGQRLLLRRPVRPFFRKEAVPFAQLSSVQISHRESFTWAVGSRALCAINGRERDPIEAHSIMLPLVVRHRPRFLPQPR
jgi:hypothetical protein